MILTHMFILQQFDLSWHKDLRVHGRSMCWDVSTSVDHAPIILFNCHGMKGNQFWKYNLVSLAVKAISVHGVLKMQCRPHISIFWSCLLLPKNKEGFFSLPLNLILKRTVVVIISHWHPCLAWVDRVVLDPTTRCFKLLISVLS